MAVRTRRNDYGDCVYDESDLLELIYSNPDLDISQIIVDHGERYNASVQELSLDLPRVLTEPKHSETVSVFDRSKTGHWFMPESYQNMDVKKFLLDRCTNDTERQRVEAEYALFEQKGFTKVLQFLIYFVDTLRANNVVWGVGRGSSVSSFCLFLIGIHKINPLIYNLDYREFLR